MQRILIGILNILLLISCNNKPSNNELAVNGNDKKMDAELNKYVSVKLDVDLTQMSENQLNMIKQLIKVGEIMDELFWMQAYGEKTDLMPLLDNAMLKKFAKINYGPWDRLNNNQPFVEGIGPKPPGANFYPPDMTKTEFENANLPEKESLYTLLRRDNQGNLVTAPYHIAYEELLNKASELLKSAADFADNEDFKKYLLLRASALLTDEYYESDVAWLNLKNNPIDIITGPIENYEDQLFGKKAAYTTYVLVKDMDWSNRLSKYTALLPELQAALPVEDRFKLALPGSANQLAVFDVIYYAGDCNAGSKTIAVNLPNDEEVQLKYGTRRSQLKNAMKAKFDQILVPIANVLISEEQRQFIDFDAFFANTMFHEVAHGLGIKQTINGQGTVRDALQELGPALEEGKADILGLFMITKLREMGEIEGDLMNYYTTFMASIFRSVRFGASSAHGKANMIRFNYFESLGAFERAETTGTYQIVPDKMQKAMNELSSLILTLQGEGDYEGVKQLVESYGQIDSSLQNDLERLSHEGIPVDITFEQGATVLGLD